MPMMKYIGTSTASKNTKKKKRSRDRNTPSVAVSRISVYTTNSLRRSVIEADAASEIGTRIAVRTTSGIEMPSMPTCHEIPHGSHHTARSTNWYPATGSNTAKMYPARARGSTDTAVPSGRITSLRRRGTNRTAIAPSTGSRMSQVSISPPSPDQRPGGS